MSWGSLLVRMGGFMLLLPLVLRLFTTEEVLIWQLLSTLTLIIAWIDFGFGPTFTRLVAFSRGGGTLRELERTLPMQGVSNDSLAADEPLQLGAVLGTQRRVYLWLALAGTALAAIGGTAALVEPIGKLHDSSDGWTAWGLTLATSLLTLLNTYNSSVIIGFNHIARIRRLEMVVGGMQLAAGALAVAFGGGLAMLAATSLVGAIVMLAISHRLAQDCFGREDRIWFAPGILHVVWPAAWRAGLGSMLGAGVIQMSGIIVAQVAEAAEAASYLVALRMLSILAQVANVPLYTKLPLLSELRAERNVPAIRTIAARGMRWTAWIQVSGSQALIWIAPLLLHLIGSSVEMPAARIVALMALAQFVERYASMHLQIYTTTNHVLWHVAAGISGVLNLILFAVLIPFLGILGVPLAMLVGTGVFNAVFSSRLSLRSMETDRRHFDLRVFLAPLLVLCVGIAAALQAEQLGLFDYYAGLNSADLQAIWR